MTKTVEQIIEDLKRGYRYQFTIKPEEEDEQSYFPPAGRKRKWGVLAYCFMATITTEKLINRLENRKTAIVIEKERQPTLEEITEK